MQQNYDVMVMVFYSTILSVSYLNINPKLIKVHIKEMSYYNYVIKPFQYSGDKYKQHKHF